MHCEGMKAPVLRCDGPAGPRDEARLFTPGKKEALEGIVVETR